MTQPRAGILGLETEHLVFYVPQDPPGDDPGGSARDAQAAATPSFELQQMVLFDCLLAGRKAAVSSGLKGGYFLENGGLAHLEIYFRDQSDAPILEVCTPECRSPNDCLEYSRAFDEILDETSRRTEPAFLRYGYRGRLAFGKNNLDSRGVGYGCHENYLVHRRAGRAARALTWLLLPLLYALYLPGYLLFLCILWLIYASIFAAASLPNLESFASRVLAFVRARLPWIIEAARWSVHLLQLAVLFPFLHLYCLVARAIAFGPYFRHLTSFLVTRQILVGTGHLDFRRGAFELSQRAGLTRKLGEVVMFGRRKTVYDLKVFLRDFNGIFHITAPLGPFRPTNRLSLAVGDSNLSDVPGLIKTGATFLILEMIEAGERFDDLRLARPIEALRSISSEGPWKILRTRSGRLLTAIEIQREYLRRAKAFYVGRPEGRVRNAEILRVWEEAVEALSDGPSSASRLLDWAAKKALLDRAILQRTNWKVFFAWGRLFDLAGVEVSAAARSLGELLQKVSFGRRRRAGRLARRLGLDPEDFHRQKELHFQCRKIDLRYHELGGGTSYQRALESEGLIRRLVLEEAVERATREPPQDTRARVRGYYIQRSNRPEMLQVNWNGIELQSPLVSIPTPDPFCFTIPAE